MALSARCMGTENTFLYVRGKTAVLMLKISDTTVQNIVGRETSDRGYIQACKNSVALVRERTIPTERPPPVGEVSANF